MAKRRAISGPSGNYIVQCDMCGKEFFALRRTAMYCGNACKQRGYRVMKEAKQKNAELRARWLNPVDRVTTERD